MLSHDVKNTDQALTNDDLSKEPLLISDFKEKCYTAAFLSHDMQDTDLILTNNDV